MSHHIIRLLIVEDHLIARVGLKAILSTQADMAVVGEAAGGREALEAHAALSPDVTLMDLRLPGTTGADVMAAIRRRMPEARFIALSTYSGDVDVTRALDAGASAYLTKDVLDTELIRAIRTVHSGGTYLSPTVQAILTSRPSGPALTAREYEVLTLIVRGLGNKQIADELGIAEYTVKNHAKNLFTKLGVEDRTEAATTALRRGLVP